LITIVQSVRISQIMSKNIKIIYVPIELGAKYGGTDKAPGVFKKLGFEQTLQGNGFTTEAQDIECKISNDLQPEPVDRPYVAEIINISEQSAALTKQAISDNQIVVAVGGDHTVDLGVFSGASSALGSEDIGLIYIDAHGDMNTPASSTSHNVHGMHLAALLGHGTDDMINVCQPKVKLKSENLLHIGASDLDQFEVDLMKSENIPNYSVNDILMNGLAPLTKMIYDLASRASSIWVSFDLDSIDQTLAPGVGIPNPGGLTYREIRLIASYVAARCNVVGIDIVECNPPQDVDDKTVKLGIEIATNLLGGSSNQYSQYMNKISAD